MKGYWGMLTLFLLAVPLEGQELDALHISRGNIVYQISADEVVPAGTRLPGWGSWVLEAGASFNSGWVSDLRISGPGFPEGKVMPDWEGEPNEYQLEEEFASEAELMAFASPGTYTFTGNGSEVGFFSEAITIGTDPLMAPRRIANYDDLQAIDPALPVIIEFSPPPDMGEKIGWMEVEISLINGIDNPSIWSNPDPEEGFGLPADTPYIELPPGTLNVNPEFPLEVVMFTGRIDVFIPETVFDSGIKGMATTSETIAHIRMRRPGQIVPPVNDWIQDSRLGWIFGLSWDWGYSPDLGFIWLGYTPNYLFQQHLGWLAPAVGNMNGGCWFYCWTHGWIRTEEGLRGWYHDPAGNWGNMISP